MNCNPWLPPANKLKSFMSSRKLMTSFTIQKITYDTHKPWLFTSLFTAYHASEPHIIPHTIKRYQ